MSAENLYVYPCGFKVGDIVTYVGRSAKDGTAYSSEDGRFRIGNHYTVAVPYCPAVTNTGEYVVVDTPVDGGSGYVRRLNIPACFRRVSRTVRKHNRIPGGRLPPPWNPERWKERNECQTV